MMPHLRLPHLPSSTDLAGGLGTALPSKDVFFALHSPTQDPLSSTSPRPSVEALPTQTSLHDITPHQNSSPTVMSVEEPESMQWSSQGNCPLGSQVSADYNISVPFAPSTGDFYNYAQNGLSYNDNYNLHYAGQYGASCPRSYNGIDLTGLPNSLAMTDAYPPAAYQIEPQKHHNPTSFSDHGLNDHLMQMSDDYEHHYGSHIKHDSVSGYQSPYSDMTRASTPHDDPPRYPHELNCGDEAAIDKEQPYAQLIYKALLHAKGHTMILRDIYDWFKQHTDKASASETKGWQNSIRHNLSMNGAFEKVDQPCEETRKGFMWRLTDEAIREGVKSTTRYRSKQPNKRAHRTQQPQPQRQASGAKGGQAARRSANLRRSKRMNDQYRSDPYISRSVPAAFDPSYNEAPMPYPPSPYYGSDADFSYASENEHNLGSPLMGHHGMDLFPPARQYAGSEPMRGLPMGDQTAYVLEQCPDQSLFTNSPTPEADEPRTPPGSQQGGWSEEMLGAPCVFEEMAYSEYAG